MNTTEKVLDGKVAFVTGGNRGIGFETARELGRLGAIVVIGVRNRAKGEEAVSQLLAEGIQADILALDLTNSEDLRGAYAYFEQQFGRLDILINNAGVQLEVEHLSPMNNTTSVSYEVLRQTFNANFFAQVELTQLLLPLLRKSPAARIVNLSSILGSLTLQSDSASPIYDLKLLAYNASKAAVNSFTIHLAHELKETPIKVNAAHPGWVKTELGGKYADTDVSDGAKTSIRLATLPENGPSGRFIHMETELPW
ncbi:NAD(P)-dependent dehydrogenase (short-subunit alcohol dehydrogenase family) [Paenibacillus rhizosphaerae]|uniref:NAD(P)-dependent dehydrogenase (Short-subunit alcohol dehydrogenase family) n=1 Tax=Paenibacillus rhizosphaerae TaxID=297318 RepID=A0A839TQ63_9BACL|nr:SDR family oxidoreductase [Paenibacillus rhizosphaerae]MBB3128701.1 NAD(P)-dependent dehydrogenase (short-subunit alcohol dehydrogenase family) [Paenibacillus rhizosphaerae]